MGRARTPLRAVLVEKQAGAERSRRPTPLAGKNNPIPRALAGVSPVEQPHNPMRKLLVLAACLLACRAFCADGVAVFQAGLQAFQESGPDALLSTWYSGADNADKIAKIRESLTATVRGLGRPIEVEVFAPRDLGSRVQRLYGAIYFEKRPLWLRADYYSVGGRSGFISLEFSIVPDQILPWVQVSPPQP